MPSEDRVRTTVSKFLSDLSIPKLTAMLAGTEYDLFDLSLQFNDWIGLFAKEFETRKDLGCEYSDVLVQLLRNEDLERIVNDTNIKDYPDAAEWYFIGGFYDQISDIDTCLGMSTTSLKERIRRAKVEALERHKIRIPRRGITRRRAKDRPNPTKREEIPNKIPEEIPLEDRIRLSQTFQKTGIVGNAPAMFNVYDEIAHTCEQLIRFPKQPLNVLITGPSGTGKQLVAEAIHKLSGRQGEFRKIDCSAIPPQLLESELFGYRKGAFTGAEADRKGILQTCNNGTIQLDEINKMQRYHQEKILRVLQDRQIQQVGAIEPEDVDILFIATGNEDLTELVNEGEFAPDLYQRLAAAEIQVPSLRERTDDIPLLVNHFLQKWPGNPLDQYRFPIAVGSMEKPKAGVRELEHVIGDLVRRSLDLERIWLQNPRESALRDAVAAAEAVVNKRPVPLSEVAKRLTWTSGKKTKKEEKSGYAVSSLYDEPWRSLVEKLRDEGLIKMGQRR